MAVHCESTPIHALLYQNEASRRRLLDGEVFLGEPVTGKPGRRAAVAGAAPMDRTDDMT